MVKLVSKAGSALKRLAPAMRESIRPAIGTRSEVSPAGNKRMAGLSEFYRLAMLGGDTYYRTRFPHAGFYPS